MIEINLLITFLQKTVKKIKKKTVPHSNFDIYLFGSVLNSEFPNDIDLLIVYEKQHITTEMLEFKSHLMMTFKDFDSRKLHISMATLNEIYETNFLKKITYTKIEL